MLEFAREIQMFGYICKEHTAEIHSTLRYLETSIFHDIINTQRDELLGKLEILKANKELIRTLQDDNPETSTDWETFLQHKKLRNTPEMELLITESNKLVGALDPMRHVTIHLNSGGGSVLDGLAIIDIIQSTKIPVEIIATGEVQSMAVPILASATGTRYATKNTIFMMHDSHGGAEGNAEDLRIRADVMEILENKIKKIMIKHTKLKSKQYDKLNKREAYYFDAKKALELGIIDEIVGE